MVDTSYEGKGWCFRDDESPSEIYPHCPKMAHNGASSWTYRLGGRMAWKSSPRFGLLPMLYFSICTSVLFKLVPWISNEQRANCPAGNLPGRVISSMVIIYVNQVRHKFLGRTSSLDHEPKSAYSHFLLLLLATSWQTLRGGWREKHCSQPSPYCCLYLSKEWESIVFKDRSKK